MKQVCLAFLASLVVATVRARYDPAAADSAMYEDMLVEDLYKRLSQLANSAIFDDMGGAGGVGGGAMDYPGQPWGMDDIALESRESGQADLRDHEYLEHSSIGDGFQYISGGAGEGKQHLTPNGGQDNTQEVKSDEVLPFYCHPPNPCPKGKTAEKDGCHDFVEDTAETQQEWILKMQSRGMCACDEEHMFKCPQDEAAEEGGEDYDQDELDQVLDRLLGSDVSAAENPYIVKTAKREYIVPKKRIRMRRSAAKIDAALDQLKAAQIKRNPYLSGPEVHRVAKKG